MRTSALILAVVVVTSACARESGTAPSSVLLADIATAPAGIQRDCGIATRRCSRCHPLDRIITTRVPDAAGWQTYARRMRLTPGSGIPAAEEPAIVRCLAFRAFGQDGLNQLVNMGTVP